MATATTGREQFLGSIRPYFTENEVQLVFAAYVLAKYGHRGQTRDGGERYFDHPRAVADIIIRDLNILIDWRIIVTALLHDVWEDSWILSEWLTERIFGPEVTRWIKFLTKEPGIDYHDRLKSPWQVKLIKLCDRLHNLRSLGSCTEEKQQKQIAETRVVYVPLAKSLVNEVPRELRHSAIQLLEEIKALCASY